jgi:coenzyme F420-reducing hydrogenase beta subunit
MLVSIVADVTTKDGVLTVVVDKTTIADGLNEAIEQAREYQDYDPEDLDDAESISKLCYRAMLKGRAQFIYWDIH